MFLMPKTFVFLDHSQHNNSGASPGVLTNRRLRVKHMISSVLHPVRDFKE